MMVHGSSLCWLVAAVVWIAAVEVVPQSAAAGAVGDPDTTSGSTSFTIISKPIDSSSDEEVQEEEEEKYNEGEALIEVQQEGLKHDEGEAFLVRRDDGEDEHNGENAVVIFSQKQQQQQQEGSILPRWLLATTEEDLPAAGVSAMSDSCSQQTNCKNCTKHSSMCHWCSHDQACHARGSYYGCFSGVSCNENDDGHKDDDSNHTDVDDHHCSSHQSCSECALSSHFCHWCAHDNACHALGSWYGCVTGVDCYSNDRCQRSASEPMSSLDDAPPRTKRATIIMAALISFFCCLACCATACFCCCGRGCHRAYEDDVQELLLLDPLLLLPPTATLETHSRNQQDPNQDSEPDMTTPLLSSSSGDHANETTPRGEAAPDPPEEYECDEVETEARGNSLQMVDLEEQQQQQQQPPGERPTPSSRSRVRKQRSRIQCLYSTCTFCYGITLAVLGGLAFGSVRYYPKMIEYNICNDSVAWEQLVQSMAKMQASADIQILASVANYNPIDVALDKGGGSFRHDGSLVGTFDIPPVTVAAKSITDILITAHFTPEKWQALKIGEEYYKGKLILNVDAAGTIRVPSLYNYTFEGKLQNLTVHVNEINGRRLCHCPSWDQAKNGTKPSLWDELLPAW